MQTCSQSVALPICLILAGIMLALNAFGVVHVHNIWNLWPIILIAAGMEKLYLWATKSHGRNS
jgi:hypothetical protein